MGSRSRGLAVWLVVGVLQFLAACNQGSSDSGGSPPAVADLRVRQDSGGVAGSPTRFTVGVAFHDGNADVNQMEVKRRDTDEASTVDLPDAAGQKFGLAEGSFEITATEAGEVPMTMTLVDARGHHSPTMDFGIAIQPAPVPAPVEDVTEELKRRSLTRSLSPRGGRVRQP
jgi:hypothetical protein